MAPRRQSSAAADRFSRIVATFGIVLGLLYLGTAFLDRARLVPGLIERLVPALALMTGGVAVGWIGSRVGTLLLRLDDLSRRLDSAANDHISDFRQIADRLESLAAAEPARSTPRPSPVTSVLPPSDESDDPDALPDPLPMPVPEPESPTAGTAETSSPSAPPASPGEPAMNDRIIALLEEIREAALMGDDERRAELQRLRDNRRRAGIDQASALVRSGQWAKADQLLTDLDGQFPDDALVRQAREEFQRLRVAAEPDTLFQTEPRVRELVQANAWDRAIAMANEFVANFPASEDGRRLLTNVYREHDAYLDATFHRLYEQFQSSVDRRQWRAALGQARRLLDQFPNHARADRVRRQLDTIAANAEIEERQEQEVRLQLLVKNQRFAEAVELAEEVIRRFPNSPQADALEARLPQLRELADLGEGNGL